MKIRKFLRDNGDKIMWIVAAVVMVAFVVLGIVSFSSDDDIGTMYEERYQAEFSVVQRSRDADGIVYVLRDADNVAFSVYENDYSGDIEDDYVSTQALLEIQDSIAYSLSKNGILNGTMVYISEDMFLPFGEDVNISANEYAQKYSVWNVEIVIAVDEDCADVDAVKEIVRGVSSQYLPTLTTTVYILSHEDFDAFRQSGAEFSLGDSLPFEEYDYTAAASFSVSMGNELTAPESA